MASIWHQIAQDYVTNKAKFADDYDKTEFKVGRGLKTQKIVKGWKGIMANLKTGNSRNNYASKLKTLILEKLPIDDNAKAIIANIKTQSINVEPQKKASFERDVKLFDDVKTLYDCDSLRTNLQTKYGFLHNNAYEFVPKDLDKFKASANDVAETLATTKAKMKERQLNPIKIFKGQKFLFDVLEGLKSDEPYKQYPALLLASGARPIEIMKGDIEVENQIENKITINYIAKKRADADHLQDGSKVVLANPTLLVKVWKQFRASQFKNTDEISTMQLNRTYGTKLNNYCKKVAKELNFEAIGIKKCLAHEYRRIYAISAYEIMGRGTRTQAQFIMDVLKHYDYLTVNYSSVIVSNIKYVWTGDSKIDEEHLKECDPDNPAYNKAVMNIGNNMVNGGNLEHKIDEVIMLLKTQNDLLIKLVPINNAVVTPVISTSTAPPPKLKEELKTVPFSTDLGGKKKKTTPILQPEIQIRRSTRTKKTPAKFQ